MGVELLGRRELTNASIQHDRHTVGEEEGLLLVFPVTGEVCISQAFVGFPIDAVFIGEDLRVLEVATNIPAGSDSLVCVDAVRYVLEVAATRAAEVEPGATVGL